LPERENLVGLFLIIDIRRGITAQDEQLVEWAAAAGWQVHLLLTKSDKLNQRERAAALKTAQASLSEGMTAQLRVPRLEACDACKGSGAAPGTQSETCPGCAGTGQVRYQQGFFSVARTCGQCRGAGRVIRTPCETCKGAGRVEREKQIEVKIPAGVETGSRLRLAGRRAVQSVIHHQPREVRKLPRMRAGLPYASGRG